MLKSRENIQKTVSSHRSTPKRYRNDLTRTHEKTINLYSTEKINEQFNFNASPVTRTEDRKSSGTNEYKDLSNDELAKLVADIKKEFNPKSAGKVQETQASTITPSKARHQSDYTTKFSENKSDGGVKEYKPISGDKNIHTGSSLKKEFSSELNSFEAKIDELKKDLQKFFT